MLSYGAYAWSAQRLIDHIGMQDGERLFSYLPLAHITERVYIMGSAMMAGICTAFPESLDTFIEDVKKHRPTLFISVPRLWTLFQQRIQEKLPDSKLNLLLKIPFVSGLSKRKLPATWAWIRRGYWAVVQRRCLPHCCFGMKNWVCTLQKPGG